MRIHSPGFNHVNLCKLFPYLAEDERVLSLLELLGIVHAHHPPVSSAHDQTTRHLRHLQHLIHTVSKTNEPNRIRLLLCTGTRYMVTSVVDPCEIRIPNTDPHK